LDALLTFHLTGIQLRILLWVLRNTDGWNRKLTPFRWYQIAKKLGSSRTVVWRAGQKLLEANVLLLEAGQLGIQKDDTQWSIPRLAPTGAGARQLWIPGIGVAWEQRRPLPECNADVTAGQHKRYLEATLFPRSKESSKDIVKTYIKTPAASTAPRQQFRNSASSQHRDLAGAATPIPGKYDGLSEN
jgi:phage replication O-like protein O